MVLDFLKTLNQKEISPKFISFGGEAMCLVFGLDELHREQTLTTMSDEMLGAGHIHFDRATVSLIGEGITHELDINILGSTALEDFQIYGMSTSRFRISWILNSRDVIKAASILHRVFNLARPSTEAV
jgi:aspartokinase